MKKALSIILALAMALALVACGGEEKPTTAAPTTAGPTQEAPTTAEQKEAYTLVLVHGNNLGTPNDNWANYFKKLVEERSEGRITVEVYPNNQMGTERELTEGVQVGTYDIQVTGLISSLSFIPALATLNLPFLFNGLSADQIDTALNTGKYADLMQAAYKDSSFRLLGGFMQAATFRNITANREIKSVKDLEGFKIRIVENAYSLAFWNGVKASPTPVTWAETYLALQNGTVEGQENPFDNIFLGNIQEVQKYLVISEHLLNVNHMIMNEAKFASLSAEDQALIEECAAESRKQAAAEMGALIGEYHQKLLDAGMTEIVLDEATIAELKAAAAPVYELVKSDVGADLYNAINDAVAAVK
ncbi:MAG: TRAP transporter substrate-binding protein [Lachnospiraceae bacterium]|nr:TRAP transporter substrate-binding protein [Candidatus Minthocola equi]